MPASISRSKAVRLHSKQITVASAQRYASLRGYIMIMPASISQSKAVRLHSKQITVASAQGYAICGAIVKIRQLSFIEASRRTPYSKRRACAALVRQLLVYRGVATHTLLQTEGKRRFRSTALVYRGAATHTLLQTEGLRRFSSTAARLSRRRDAHLTPNGGHAPL